MIIMKCKNANAIYSLMLLFLFVCSVVCNGISIAQDTSTEQPAADQIDTKPFVVFYSRTGRAQMVATALKNQLGCEMGQIMSNSEKGIFTIFLEQIFNRDDDQQPFTKDLKDYNPVIIVSPIWLMKLSSPARTFIKQGSLKGKDVYVFTTSGGPLPEGRKEAVKKFASKYGLNVKKVIGLQIGKKIQTDFDKEIQDILRQTPLIPEVIKSS